jgi:hypothetical protein
MSCHGHIYGKTDENNESRLQIEGFANLFEGKPVIGFVSMLAKDYLPLIDSYHFC